MNEVFFNYMRHQNEFFTAQKRHFAMIRSIDPEGYIQTETLRKVEREAFNTKKDVMVARMDYFEAENK